MIAESDFLEDVQVNLVFVYCRPDRLRTINLHKFAADTGLAITQGRVILRPDPRLTVMFSRKGIIQLIAKKDFIPTFIQDMDNYVKKFTKQIDVYDEITSEKNDNLTRVVNVQCT